MKYLLVVFLGLFLAAFLVQSYFIFKERNQFKVEVDNLNQKLQALTSENINLNSEIEYFKNPENLEKEIKSKFNYRHPDEKMMIIVP